MGKRVFSRNHNKIKIFDRRIWKSGQSRGIGIGRMLPQGWLYVRCKILNADDQQVTIQFLKLAEEPNGAHFTQNRKTGQPNP